MKELPLPFDRQGRLFSKYKTNKSYGFLANYNDYGLTNSSGAFKQSVVIKSVIYSSLVCMNDLGVTWPEIADYIEKNPENVFTKSV